MGGPELPLPHRTGAPTPTPMPPPESQLEDTSATTTITATIKAVETRFGCFMAPAGTDTSAARAGRRPGRRSPPANRFAVQALREQECDRPDPSRARRGPRDR